MLNNVTPHTLHYSNEGTAVSKRGGMETFMPIIMIIVGAIGVYMILNSL